VKPKTFEESLAEVRAVAEECNPVDPFGPLPVALDQNQLRIDAATTAIALLSPYTFSEARAIVEAIVACRPVSEIVPLLTCSHRDL
jgi:hypothetical protein